jgi:hypothetical protein
LSSTGSVAPSPGGRGTVVLAGGSASIVEAFTPGSEQIMSLQTPGVTVQTDFAEEHHCDFWAEMG